MSDTAGTAALSSGLRSSGHNTDHLSGAYAYAVSARAIFLSENTVIKSANWKEKKKKTIGKWIGPAGFDLGFCNVEEKEKKEKAICMDLEQLDWTLWLITPLWKKYLGKITAEQQ